MSIGSRSISAHASRNQLRMLKCQTQDPPMTDVTKQNVRHSTVMAAATTARFAQVTSQHANPGAITKPYLLSLPRCTA